MNVNGWPLCDCGYECRGETVEERILDAQQHATEAHGIDVTADQILQQRTSRDG
jgi:predicted small metal-binding protein